MNKTNIFWQSYLNLENEFLDLTKYIQVTDYCYSKKKNSINIKPSNKQLETYSTYIADFIVKCSVQIESLSKEIYKCKFMNKSEDLDKLYFDTDCLRKINDKLGLCNCEIMITSPYIDFKEDENKYILPLYNAEKEGKINGNVHIMH